MTKSLDTRGAQMSTPSRRTALFVLFLAAGVVPAAEPEAVPRVRLLVPAYFYPADEGLKSWDRLLKAPARGDLVVIVNPASGPGDKVDPNYVRIVGRAAKADLTLVGYVATRYGKRPAADVKADVDRWTDLYPGVRGIFFDEQNSGPDFVDYQGELCDYVHKKDGLKLVVSNPGTTCAAGYLTRPAADVCCVFEGAKGVEDLRRPDGTDKLPPSRFAAVAHGVGTVEAMRACLAAAAKKVGSVYVTDHEGANPYDRLPRYWDEETAAVRKANEAAAR